MRLSVHFFTWLRAVPRWKFVKFTASILGAVALVFAHYSFGSFDLVRQNTVGIYNIAMQSRQCHFVQRVPIAAENICSVGDLRWVRLDDHFYAPPNNVYPTNHAAVLRLLTAIEALNPKLIALDFDLSGASDSDPVLQYLRTRWKRCARECTPIILAIPESENIRLTWRSLDGKGLRRSGVFLAEVSLDDDETDGLAETYRPILTGLDGMPGEGLRSSDIPCVTRPHGCALEVAHSDGRVVASPRRCAWCPLVCEFRLFERFASKKFGHGRRRPPHFRSRPSTRLECRLASHRVRAFG